MSKVALDVRYPYQAEQRVREGVGMGLARERGYGIALLITLIDCAQSFHMTIVWGSRRSAYTMFGCPHHSPAHCEHFEGISVYRWHQS